MSGDACTWTLSRWDEYYDTQCGKSFTIIDGTPSDNDMRFCCYCGKPLVAVALPEESEDE